MQAMAGERERGLAYVDRTSTAFTASFAAATTWAAQGFLSTSASVLHPCAYRQATISTRALKQY